MARPLVTEIFNWFQAPQEDMGRLGLGLPVYYRMRPFPDKGIRDIDLSDAQVNIIVPFVDENMVADLMWRQYLDKLSEDAKKQQSGYIFPVPLHPSSYHLTSLSTLNFLRIDRASDSKDETPEEQQARRIRRIRQRLTEVTCRTLLRKLDTDGQDKPITVFVSHAKADGLLVAEKLRNSIYNYGQLQAFFDESDIPIGHEFANVLTDQARGTACMLTVLSDVYSSRPWCREEIVRARLPRLEEKDKNTWRVNPILAVDCLESALTHLIPELGNCPIVRWAADREGLIIDTLIRQLLITLYQRMNAQRIANRCSEQHQQILSWVPDPISIQSVLAEKPDASEIIFPGHGLSGAERSLLDSLFKNRVPKIKFTTYEEVQCR